MRIGSPYAIGSPNDEENMRHISTNGDEDRCECGLG